MQEDSFADSDDISESEDGTSNTEDYDCKIQNLVISNQIIKRDLQKLKRENQILQIKLCNIQTECLGKNNTKKCQKECILRYNQLMDKHNTLVDKHDSLLYSFNKLINSFNETCSKIDSQFNAVYSNHSNLVTQLNQRMGFY